MYLLLTLVLQDETVYVGGVHHLIRGVVQQMLTSLVLIVLWLKLGLP